jgi:DNA polymerase-1
VASSQRSNPITRTLLIDADIVAYQSSASTEKKYDWGDTGGAVKATNLDAAKRSAEEEIAYLIRKLKADDVIICLSDDVHNFREQVWSGYKQNRVSAERPEHLYDIKEWLAEDYVTDIRPYMEADDVMGILSTEPHEGERIIVSQDKDMQTIPGLLFNPSKDKKVRKITPEFAERFMLWQALTGDQTDGYKGCPGCGPTMANKVLDEDMVFVGAFHEFKRGKRKGETEVRWSLEPNEGVGDVWSRIVSVYERFGLSEKDAIQQVNLARILKHSDVDGSRVIPWVPSMLTERVN